MPAVEVKQEFDQKNMIFRRLGSRSFKSFPLVYRLADSPLSPAASGCPSSPSADVSPFIRPTPPVAFLTPLQGLTLGGTVTGDPVKDIVQTAFSAGINMYASPPPPLRVPNRPAGLTPPRRTPEARPRSKCACVGCTSHALNDLQGPCHQGARPPSYRPRHHDQALLGAPADAKRPGPEPEAVRLVDAQIGFRSDAGLAALSKAPPSRSSASASITSMCSSRTAVILLCPWCERLECACEYSLNVPTGRDCPRVQLCHREGPGKASAWS